MRRVYPGILSKTVAGESGGDEASEFGDAVRTVLRSAEPDEGRMKFLLVEQVRNESKMDFCIEKCLFERYRAVAPIGAGCCFALSLL